MKTKTRERQARVQLPILIRYRAQDYETRYVEDPRALYVEQFRQLHGDDGFFAIIPSEAPAGEAPAKAAPRVWWSFVRIALTIGLLGWIVHRIVS